MRLRRLIEPRPTDKHAARHGQWVNVLAPEGTAACLDLAGMAMQSTPEEGLSCAWHSEGIR